MRAATLALAFALFPGAGLQADIVGEGNSPPVITAWYQLCGGKRSLPFDTQVSCCCFTDRHRPQATAR